MITISYCKTLEPTEWSSFHMWWVFPPSHLCSGSISGLLQPGRDAKCDSLFSSCMLVSCVLTHEGMPVNVFFFSSVKGESLFFGWSFNSATGQFGWIFHSEIWNLAYAVLLSLKAQCPAIMWRHVWWSWECGKESGTQYSNRILCNRPVCKPVCRLGYWQWII